VTDHLPPLSIAETDELVALARLLSEGAFEADQQARLEELVHQRGDGQATYFRASQLGAALQWYFAPEAAAVRQKMPSLLEEICNGSSLAGLESVPQVPVRLTQRAVTLSSLASQWKASWLSPRVLGFAVIGLLVTYFSLIVFSILWDQSHSNRHERTNLVATDEPGFATIATVVDCQWKESTAKRTGERLGGSTVSLQRGIVELSLDRGAKVTIEGPADWSVNDKNSVSLRAGKLVAHVPEQAIGFTVETPTAKVVDLGTEFGVAVSNSGTTEVQVFKGKIEVHPGQKITKVSSATDVITLSAGEARQIEFADKKGNVVVRKIAASPDRFGHSSDESKGRRIMVAGALASSTFPGAPVNNLINGSGLRGECHAAKPSSECNMWHTEIGKVKDEYVLFDLGRSYRLNSMKVWNYNDSYVDMHHWRGVKQADIYISTSGRGTPLDHPEDWKLVAEDVQFEPGTGTPEYDTPSQIPLRDASARFVAIVIDEALGHDPRGTDLAGAYGDVVGLSEVQFFGVRSTPSLKEQR
jgi:hypothetical protein